MRNSAYPCSGVISSVPSSYTNTSLRASHQATGHRVAWGVGLGHHCVLTVTDLHASSSTRAMTPRGATATATGDRIMSGGHVQMVLFIKDSGNTTRGTRGSADVRTS